MMESKMTEASLYLTFRLGEGIFALDVSQVKEILDVKMITKIPQSADFMRGMINLRGNVVPVVDLKSKFGLGRTESDTETRIVVVEIDGGDEIVLIGALADSVHDVIDLASRQIENAPKIGFQTGTEYIRGIGSHNDRFVIIIDIEKVFLSEALICLKAMGDTDVPVREENRV